jgi:hypothetical protein
MKRGYARTGIKEGRKEGRQVWKDGQNDMKRRTWKEGWKDMEGKMCREEEQ